MKTKKIKLIYFFGPGRSGTTILSTVLNAHKEIKAVGELHQFYDYLSNNKECSCTTPIRACGFWQPILNRLPYAENQMGMALNQTRKQEKHHKVLQAAFDKPTKEYTNYQKALFKAISEQTEEKYILDSSKYVARYLWLKKMEFLDVKGIYLVRDVRGVVNSFGKNVQTSRGPLSAILYYVATNTIAQMVSWLHKGTLKIRYEDLMEDPNQTIDKIFKHLYLEPKIFDFDSELFDMPHIVGGNRIKSKSKLKLNPDEKWKSKMTKGKKLFYYMLAYPLMAINKYKIL